MLVLAATASSRPATNAVSPGAFVDQTNPGRQPACGWMGWVPDDGSSWAAQTFTAGVSGALSDVVLPLAMRTPQIVVALTPVGADGRPVVASPLARSTLTVTPRPSYAYEDVAVAFSPPPRVKAGQQYAIVLSAPSTSSTGVAWRADLGSSLTDTSHNRCADGVYVPGRPWVSSGKLGADADFFFQTFVIPARRLTVTLTGTGVGKVQDTSHGIDCGTSCSGDLLAGEAVTLTAIPAPGASFVGWSGACTGTSTTCSFTASNDTTVSALFTRSLVTLNVRRTGAGTVTSRSPAVNCGKRCSSKLAPGSVVKLTARPARGWRFDRWRGACRTTNPVCRFTINSASTVTASFKR